MLWLRVMIGLIFFFCKINLLTLTEELIFGLTQNKRSVNGFVIMMATVIMILWKVAFPKPHEPKVSGYRIRMAWFSLSSDWAGL